uniref:DUF881 domain-containing protein n=1 Tax=Vaginimicrobium propionicum TaxID=1871034 RepID=UPI0009FA8F77|nr:DUF881 domain-containing protein [Vaginimicrobium propionicum]
MTNVPPDASMELLNSITKQPLSPEYAAQSELRSAPLLKIMVLAVCVIAGLVTTAFAMTSGQSRPQAADERAGLIERVNAAEQANQQLREQVLVLHQEVDELRAETNIGSSAELRDLGAQAAAQAISGPGLVIELSEPSGLKADALVVDEDLRQIVNGLWQAGADGISINGHRVSSRTAIRQAGQAITINYRSLTSPYRVEAIGGKALAADFSNTSGGALLGYLKQNYGLEWSMITNDQLTLEADPGLSLNYANPA